MIRVGQGYDVHELVPKRKLILGGVLIDFHLGLKGHSDADVLIHAIIDAILGASGLGDIGKHFPDSDSKFKNARSRDLLKDVIELIKSKKYKIINIDSTIICQSPKLSKFIPKMIENIAADCNCKSSQINIKATTTEMLGFIGRSEGVAAQCSCLIESS
ncbi:MAG: 2-C-methyl-D-erythritol 2,4-cyclodiphosphate synthase [Nitrosomonadales bacterium]|jgi:2-C-methyl-D-erythritol 2,4-cyclodiphosphate synthase|nr:2-C-methyl-D-erythritol 2,4-cyclodiphosphate synthase [Nitrosomonadales bacterium]MBT3918096.1 2-C-methyl-D-erythritol 2,4-cyclodiphosphate synthase [Nitrosomonadales bacterium]MBT4182627.1 2-C-methyl-D-erythritol 2,4-cyclodiphosphate synthase [Nitrosomonadales bacterium]MBT4570632.1 2-C-methyl-D-erythritol 2,4-cyclodiphosphate synthase [Nitrosomonadales bacterium]MBT4759805.1 2-C-methyl-D-erythritol 2,4-cyclodiphosphate synthase [Nitrosomonadales bacterium]